MSETANALTLDHCTSGVKLTEAGVFPMPIVTTLEPLTAFFPAEDYHQDYARANPDNGYVLHIAVPKVCKVRDKHKGLVRKTDDE